MRRSIALASIVLAAVASPVRAQFCPGANGWVFDDVPANDLFCSYITWAAQNGVTQGCLIIDGNHRLYCPNEGVARSQMAAFLNRLTTQPDSTSPTVGTITKPGGVFLHNFGGQSVYLGIGAGNFSMTGGHNVGVGLDALKGNTTGSSNIAIGAYSLLSNATGYLNTAAGYFSLGSNTDGYENVAVGGFSLTQNSFGYRNTSVGAAALAFNTQGTYNAAFGYNALTNNSIGSGNTAIGAGALGLSTTASDNTAVGNGALASNGLGATNTAIGAHALSSNTIGEGNSAHGSGALAQIQGGSYNTAMGVIALSSLSNGNSNTALGALAMGGLTTGGNNIAIGSNAASSLISGSSNIYIGNGGAAFESSTARVGSTQTRTFIAGIRSVTTAVNDAVNVVIDSNGQLGTISSSRDAKDDIADMNDASAALMQLRPVTFHYKADHDPAGSRLQYGLIAEEVADVYPGMVATKDGKPETVMYQYLAPMLLNEYQKQQRTIETQAHEIAELRRAIEVLMARTALEAPHRR